MPVELHVIRASEFIRLDANERLDFQASAKVLEGLAQACRKRGLNSALLDLRTLPPLAKPHFTTKQIAALVGVFRNAGFSKEQRLAVLYHHDLYGGIRDFAFISRMGGLQVQAFQEYEAALQWLSAATESEAECRRGEVSIPITKKGNDAKKLPVRAGVQARRVRTRRTGSENGLKGKAA
ncbi:MAG TPA: hypothetical protein VL361_14845 [Candidatus Limnocylindrales bacterium]|jgi:hypothetical protein|nr:hypothetical protein [Candidatus Limnocylindrales bacterium]